jgi:hypothetical protein
MAAFSSGPGHSHPRRAQARSLEDNIRSLEVNLSPEQLQRLDKASAISLGFPHDFLTLDPVKAIVFGGLRDRIKA